MADARPQKMETEPESVEMETCSTLEPHSIGLNTAAVDSEGDSHEIPDPPIPDPSKQNSTNATMDKILSDFYGQFGDDGFALNRGLGTGQNNINNAGPVWKTAAYTLQCAETLLRLENKPLLGSLPVRRDKAIEVAVRAAVCEAELGDLDGDLDEGRSLTKSNRMVARKLLTVLFPQPKSPFDVPPLLGCDLFHFYLRAVLLFKFLDDIKVSTFLQEQLFLKNFHANF